MKRLAMLGFFSMNDRRAATPFSTTGIFHSRNCLTPTSSRKPFLFEHLALRRRHHGGRDLARHQSRGGLRRAAGLDHRGAGNAGFLKDIQRRDMGYRTEAADGDLLAFQLGHFLDGRRANTSEP